MVTTVTTTTVTTVTTVTAGSLVLVVVLTLLLLLIQKEMLGGLSARWAARAHQLSRALNVVIVPLGIVFLVSCVVSVLDVLN